MMVAVSVNASVLTLIPLLIPIIIGALLIRYGNKKIVQQEKQTEKFDKDWEAAITTTIPPEVQQLFGSFELISRANNTTQLTLLLLFSWCCPSEVNYFLTKQS